MILPAGHNGLGSRYEDRDEQGYRHADRKEEPDRQIEIVADLGEKDRKYEGTYDHDEIREEDPLCHIEIGAQYGAEDFLEHGQSEADKGDQHVQSDLIKTSDGFVKDNGSESEEKREHKTQTYLQTDEGTHPFIVVSADIDPEHGSSCPGDTRCDAKRDLQKGIDNGPDCKTLCSGCGVNDHIQHEHTDHIHQVADGSGASEQNDVL